MKTIFKKIAIAALVSSTLAACTATAPKVAIESAQTNFNNENYQISWQQDIPAAVDVLVSTTPDLTNATLIADDITTNVFNWSPSDEHQRYYFFVKPENGEVTMTTTRLIPLEGGRNFRDLGGYKTQDGRTVKWGKIYRSGVLANLTNDDYALINSLNIDTLVDFRANSERDSEVTVWAADKVEIIDRDYEMDFDMGQIGKVLRDPNLSREKLENVMVQMYPRIVEDQKQNYTQMFDRLVNKDGGLLFHCTAGKDRTGISAALILTVLGVDQQTIMNDYLASNDYLDFENMLAKDTGKMDPKHAAMMQFFASLPKEVAMPLKGVTQPLLESAIESMEQQHGSVLNYIQAELDVSDEDIQILRAKYLL